jgi:hypothetical protein
MTKEIFTIETNCEIVFNTDWNREMIKFEFTNPAETRGYVFYYVLRHPLYLCKINPYFEIEFEDCYVPLKIVKSGSWFLKHGGFFTSFNQL